MDVRRVTDRYSVAPQIAAEDVATLRDRGFVLVINNRPDGEEPGQPAGAEIEAAAEAAGIAYRAIPVAGGFSEPQVAEMVETVAGANGPVFAFCRSGTRSTLLWALAQASQGQDLETIADAVTGAGYDVTPVRAAMDALAERGRPTS
ncbi:MAG TPA: TIGR01244 family sulfur transferase [Qipengyuania sp.]|nr:TIGR01244 family sulfur transferase [Qipengyuania sp.]